MTDMELILLFKEDNKMNEHSWKRFCRRYADKDITAVVNAIRNLYEDFEKIPEAFKNNLRREIKKSSTG